MPNTRQLLLGRKSIDTEAGMLSGMSQKHNMRSSPCRFTEFCNSQCLSHFAAPFIVDRTETSIAESCEQHFRYLVDKKREQSALEEAVAVGNAPASSACAPPPPMRISTGRLKAPVADPHETIHSNMFQHVRMILPQVHLRKPCYDFSFL